MKDTDLYSRILGLSDPWFVADVELDTAGGRVDVEHTPGIRWRCPTCGRELACRDPTEPRVWCHLDTCQFKTFLHARVHQRRGRGTQQQDHGHQAQGVRLPEPGALQDRHLFLLRRLGPLSQACLSAGTHGKPGRTLFFSLEFGRWRDVGPPLVDLPTRTAFLLILQRFCF